MRERSTRSHGTWLADPKASGQSALRRRFAQRLREMCPDEGRKRSRRAPIPHQHLPARRSAPTRPAARPLR
ncbi:hypothetical protein BIWAKO_05001 [Bosea sp. BIWAKO-01]|nr:hypothetical protein BIWAKO_05001 [Bosea sp. BIWAKO-01]